jgi:hypothetical protein
MYNRDGFHAGARELGSFGNWNCFRPQVKLLEVPALPALLEEANHNIE